MIAGDTTPLLPLTTITAGVLGMLIFGLAVYTMAQRVIHDRSWGDGGISSLRSAIRAHGNLTEYAPMLLVLMALLEIRGAEPYGVIAMGSVFVVARLLYVIYAVVAQKLPLRILGFWGSALPLAAGAVWALIG